MLFELQDEPGTFYMREAFINQAALDSHCQTDYFQAFARQTGNALLDSGEEEGVFVFRFRRK